MKKNNHDKVVAFYKELHELVANKREFDKKIAEILLATAADSPDCLSLENCSIEYLRATHAEFKDVIGLDMDKISEVTEAAFRDLAPYLRSPHAQEAWQSFINSSGTEGSDDLYVQARNSRLLGDSKDGPAVVTLVVHNLSNFLSLLEKGGRAA